MTTTARVDAWLWAVRVYKTRSAATTACRAGHVRVNGEKAKAAQTVKPGDEVRVRISGFDRMLVVRQTTYWSISQALVAWTWSSKPCSLRVPANAQRGKLMRRANEIRMRWMRKEGELESPRLRGHSYCVWWLCPHGRLHMAAVIFTEHTTPAPEHNIVGVSSYRSSCAIGLWRSNTHPHPELLGAFSYSIYASAQTNLVAA